jgi:NADPH-dependent 2,4-dienoyl-CoA reductase/sulfur reductase-like enzyme
MRRIAIVGASLAGLSAALALRREGYLGEIVLIGDEAQRPYDRPPLSKEILRGEWAPAQAELAFDPSLLAAEWRLGVCAVALEASDRRLTFSDGRRESFDGIVIATGARPRKLPGVDLLGVHTVRSMADALALREDLGRARRVAIVGAGFIGQETAASCRKLGLPVTMIEAAAPAEHVVGREIAMILANIHRAEGVDLRLGVGVAALEGHGRLQKIHLSNGERLEAEVAVIGVGVWPNTDWLVASGLTVEDGVVCDETCLAAPGIVAAGDVARWPSRRYGAIRRVEHRDNAVRQADHAARRLLARKGEPAATAPYDPVPWFWSDQYDFKLQLVGLTAGHDQVRIATGDPHDRKFTATFHKDGALVAAFGMNSAGQVLKHRWMLENSRDEKEVCGE